MEVNTRITGKGEVMSAFPGSETMACATGGLNGNAGGPEPLGRSWKLSQKDGPWKARTEYARQPHKGRKAKGDRESDQLIVPEKAGNAAGGKELNKWSSSVGRHRPRTGAGNECEQNYTV